MCADTVAAPPSVQPCVEAGFHDSRHDAPSVAGDSGGDHQHDCSIGDEGTLYMCGQDKGHICNKNLKQYDLFTEICRHVVRWILPCDGL